MAPPYTLSGFIRASLANGHILFQVRAPGGPPRSLTELAPLAGFLAAVPLDRIRFVDAVDVRPLSLAPLLPSISHSSLSPFISLDSVASAASC